MQSTAVQGLDHALREKRELIHKFENSPREGMKPVLTPTESERVGQHRDIQFTLLDRIIGQCDMAKGGFKRLAKEAAL